MENKKRYKYPNILAEMARHGDTQGTLAKIIGMTRETLKNKLYGRTEWTIGEIEKICIYYEKDYYELFKGE